MKLLKMITSWKSITVRGQIRKTRFLVYVALCLISYNETVFICHSCETYISLNIPEKQNNPQVQSAYLHIGGALKSCGLGLPMWQYSPSVLCPHKCISKSSGTKKFEMPDILSLHHPPLPSTCTVNWPVHLCVLPSLFVPWSHTWTCFCCCCCFFVLCLHFFNWGNIGLSHYISFKCTTYNLTPINTTEYLASKVKVPLVTIQLSPFTHVALPPPHSPSGDHRSVVCLHEFDLSSCVWISAAISVALGKSLQFYLVQFLQLWNYCMWSTVLVSYVEINK